MWEIFTLGEQPYSQIENSEVKDYINQGKRLSKPDMADEEMYVMNNC